MAKTSGRKRKRAAEEEDRVSAKEPQPDLDTPLPKPIRPRVIAVANQKGGVGKTTTAVNLGAALAERGLRILVVDLDPQGNASTGLGLNIRELDATMYDVLLDGVPIEDSIEPSDVRNLFVAPASLDLAGAEIELVSAMSRELKLRLALHPVREDYDYILVDCPPSLGLLTLNAFAAVGEVLVPIQCEYYALEGLGQLLHNVDLVQKALNPGLEVSTVVLVMYDARTTLAEDVATDVREHLGERVTDTVIPRTVRLSEAPSYGQPITTFDPRSRGAWAYRRLAEEVAIRGATPPAAVDAPDETATDGASGDRPVPGAMPGEAAEPAGGPAPGVEGPRAHSPSDPPPSTLPPPPTIPPPPPAGPPASGLPPPPVPPGESPAVARPEDGVVER